MTRYVNRHPLRGVVAADLRAGTPALMGGGRGGGPKRYWWNLRLDCGHVEERGVRYRYQGPGHPRGWAMLYSPPGRNHILPAPTRVRCGYCPAPTPKDT